MKNNVFNCWYGLCNTVAVYDHQEKNMENMTSPGTLLSGDNATWLEEYYQTWLRAPEQLPEDWRRFFLSPELTVQSVSGDNNVSGTTLKKQAAVIQLINAWRTQGHLRAKLDPLGLNPPADVPSLQPGFWGLSEEDLLQEFSVTFGAHTTQMPLKQLLNLLEQAWAGSQAYELAHLENREEINWLLSRIESSNAPQADAQTCIARFEKLMAAETLERYLHICRYSISALVRHLSMFMIRCLMKKRYWHSNMVIQRLRLSNWLFGKHSLVTLPTALRLLLTNLSRLAKPSGIAIAV